MGECQKDIWNIALARELFHFGKRLLGMFRITGAMLRACQHAEKGGTAAAGVHRLLREFDGLFQLALMKIRRRKMRQGTRVVGAELIDALRLLDDLVVLTRVEKDCAGSV